MEFTERRRSARHALDASPRLLPDSETLPFKCQPLDVSHRGLGIIAGRALRPDTSCMVSFDLLCRGEGKRINARGKVVASIEIQPGAYRIGINFIDMDSGSRQFLECLERHACRGSRCATLYAMEADMPCFTDEAC